MKAVKISIIIVSYNTKELLKACLESIESSRRPDDSFEVIVVDNASSDGSAEYVKRKKNIHTILNKTNVGFSRANNQGIKRAWRICLTFKF